MSLESLFATFLLYLVLCFSLMLAQTTQPGNTSSCLNDKSKIITTKYVPEIVASKSGTSNDQHKSKYTLYKSDNTISWKEAYAWCCNLTNGTGHLAHNTSKSAPEILKQLILGNAKSRGAYMGGKAEERELFFWICEKGEQCEGPMKHVNYGSTYPACLRLIKESKNRVRWVAAPCSKRATKFFICERKERTDVTAVTETATAVQSTTGIHSTQVNYTVIQPSETVPCTSRRPTGGAASQATATTQKTSIKEVVRHKVTNNSPKVSTKLATVFTAQASGIPHTTDKDSVKPRPQHRNIIISLICVFLMTIIAAGVTAFICRKKKLNDKKAKHANDTSDGLNIHPPLLPSVVHSNSLTKQQLGECTSATLVENESFCSRKAKNEGQQMPPSQPTCGELCKANVIYSVPNKYAKKERKPQEADTASNSVIYSVPQKTSAKGKLQKGGNVPKKDQNPYQLCDVNKLNTTHSTCRSGNPTEYESIYVVPGEATHDCTEKDVVMVENEIYETTGDDVVMVENEVYGMAGKLHGKSDGSKRGLNVL